MHVRCIICTTYTCTLEEKKQLGGRYRVEGYEGNMLKSNVFETTLYWCVHQKPINAQCDKNVVTT